MCTRFSSEPRTAQTTAVNITALDFTLTQCLYTTGITYNLTWKDSNPDTFTGRFEFMSMQKKSNTWSHCLSLCYPMAHWECEEYVVESFWLCVWTPWPWSRLSEKCFHASRQDTCVWISEQVWFHNGKPWFQLLFRPEIIIQRSFTTKYTIQWVHLYCMLHLCSIIHSILFIPNSKLVIAD